MSAPSGLPGNLRIWGSGVTSRSYRSHWALRELGIDMSIEKVDVPVPSGPDGKPPAEYKLWGEDEKMRSFHREKLHPDVRVPVLSVGSNHGEGYSLFESLAINYYLAKMCGGPLAPKNVEEEARILQWSIWIHAQCEASVLELNFARLMRNKEKQAVRVAPLLKALERPVKALDTWLGTHKYMLGDDRWSIADLNVASVVSWGFQTPFMEGEWLRKYPNVVRWWNETTNRPAFAQKTKTTNLDPSKL